MEDLQIEKKYFELFDFENNGQINLSNFKKVLLGYYRILILPEEINKAIEPWIVKEEPVKLYENIDPDDSLDRDPAFDDK